jgi:hypothetical protein
MCNNFIFDPCFQANNHNHNVACPIGRHSPYKIKIFSTKQSLPFGDLFPPYPVWAALYPPARSRLQLARSLPELRL